MSLSHSVSQSIAILDDLTQNISNQITLMQLMALKPSLSFDDYDPLLYVTQVLNHYNLPEDGIFNEIVRNALYLYGMLKASEISEDQLVSYLRILYFFNYCEYDFYESCLLVSDIMTGYEVSDCSYLPLYTMMDMDMDCDEIDLSTNFNL